ncbi:MAG: beta-lactamase family protein [Candidatus Hydrogenedentes bacterium]|nr:beta-lactamase family protein [Candidatus Hydrogenedentota bacterium]
MTESFNSAKMDAWRTTLSRHVESGGIPGLVALASRRGEVHMHEAGTLAAGDAKPMRRDAIFRIASMTKPVAAVAAMILVDEGVLKLDGPVDPWLPELANRRVLRRIDGPLDDTVPAARAITVRDLLTLRMGFGYIFANTKGWPIQEAINALGILQGPPHPQSLPDSDTWMRGLGALPLMCQPGEQFMYDLGLDVLGVLISRAAGQPLALFMRGRIFDPLGMKDTGFHVPPDKLHRLATSYGANPETGALEIFDGAPNSEWATPPAFPAAASGLVSTADDYHAFCTMMLHRGRFGEERILSEVTVSLMTSDQLTPAQRAANPFFFNEHTSWGLGMEVGISRGAIFEHPGRFGWDGGLGTSARTDPKNGVIGILLTQRNMDSPEPPKVFTDFWTGLYGAIQGL